MSSQDDEPSPPHVSEPEQVKRKKKQRACDYCRRKKSEHICSLWLPIAVNRQRLPQYAVSESQLLGLP